MCDDVQNAHLHVRSYVVKVRASLAQRAFYTGSTAWLGAVFEKFQSSFSLAFPWFRSAHTCHRIVATIAWASPLDPRFVYSAGDEQRSLERHALYIVFLEPESSGGYIQQSHIRPSSGFGLTTYTIWISQKISLLLCVFYVAL